jgi:hypothetical protein
MKKIICIVFLVLTTTLKAQEAVEKQIITSVKLEADKIFLNDQLAFNYLRIDSDFIISNLNGKELIRVC